MVHHCSICHWMPLMICCLELDHYLPFDPLQWDNAEEGIHNHEYHPRSLSPCPLHESVHPDPWLPSWANSSTSSLWGQIRWVKVIVHCLLWILSPRAVR